MNQEHRSTVNPFSNPDLVTGYEDWYQGSGRRADRLEKALLKELLAGFPEASTLLEVGSGTGHFGRWFAAQGLKVWGVDRSEPMLAEASRLGGPPGVRGDALALPFARDAFDLVVLITTLEFLPDPTQVLREALRVGRQGVLLGVLNRHSLLARQLKKKGGPVWEAARFASVSQLREWAQGAADGQPLEVWWQTTLWPLVPGALPLPWGGFIGMALRSTR